jgi:DnaJ-domain-containing protein 1
MIIWFGAFYGMTVVSVLWTIVRREFKHQRRCQLHGLIPQTPETGAVIVSALSGRERRLNDAFSKWTIQRSEGDLSIAAPVVTTPSMPVPARPEPRAGSTESSLVTSQLHTSQVHTSQVRTSQVRTSQEHSEFEPMETNTHDTGSCRIEEHSSLPLAPGSSDYYEIMQISRHADTETIHRVYRIMAARFHPDNPKTGNLERFLALRQANQVLSDPVQRAEYDSAHRIHETAPLVIFELKDFVDGIEGEINRRLGVLSLLYHRRRMNDSVAGLSVLELERRMSFPREYLDFTLWYLKAKGYITVIEDNSDYGLTALGVDYVESHSCTNRLIRELLTVGPGAAGACSEPAVKPIGNGPLLRRRRDLAPRHSSPIAGRRRGRVFHLTAPAPAARPAVAAAMATVQ